jgi:hypothetical protein
MVRDIIKLLGASLAREKNFIIPEDDLAGNGNTGLDLEDGGWPERVIEKLVGAAPGDLDGLAGDF